jgi:hypothetical protein
VKMIRQDGTAVVGPTDSPIEDLMFKSLVPLLSIDVKMDTQVEAQTHRGLFRLDIVLTLNAKRVAIECDGAEFHDGRRDEWRDACLMGDGMVDEIYRVRGEDIIYRMPDVLLVMARWMPALFSDRGRNRIECDATGRAAEVLHIQNDGALAVVGYDDHTRLVVERRGSELPGAFWRTAYRISKSYAPMSLDKMLAQYDLDRPWPSLGVTP